MPEPEADDYTPPVPSVFSASFPSCPPDDRDPQTHRSLETAAGSPHATALDSLQDEHMTARDTPCETTVTHPETSLNDTVKVSDDDQPPAVIDAPSRLGSPDGPSDSDARLARSMSTTAISSSPLPQYLYFPQDKSRLNCTTTSSFLRPGSKFRGTQQSDRQVYDVQVEIKDVDMGESFLCGYLRIQGLTDDHPTLTTFFEGEIIGKKHLFRTAHQSWNSSEKIDLQHWARFPAWRPLAKSAKSPNFTLKNYQQREHLFMRWKEYFLVPDHRVKTITGASFEGFYYICFNQCTGSVSGIYFHAKSEKYQQLELQHVDDKGCMGAMEFR